LASSSFDRSSRSLHSQIFRGLLATVVDDVEGDLGAFEKAIEARPLNGLDMHKHIAAAAVRRNKALNPAAVAGSSFVNELSEGVTVWLDSVGSAPADKLVRVDYDPNGEVSASLAGALAILSEFAPSFVIPGHVGRVVHDFENARIFLRLEPRSADPILPANDG